MIRWFSLFLLMTFCFFVSCEKADFGSEIEEEKPVVPDGGGEKPDEKPDGDKTDTLDVGMALADYLLDPKADKVVLVSGYIVGTIDGTSIKNAVFTSYTMVSSNLLIAKSANETDYNLCIPVELKKNSILQLDLNLHDHPEVYKRKVLISATLTTYFRVAGLKGSYSYSWLKDDGHQEDTESNLPPVIDTTSTVIPGGRMLRLK